MANTYEVVVVFTVRAAGASEAVREVRDELGAATAGVPMELPYEVAPGWVGVRPIDAPMPHAHCPECLGAIGTHRTTCSLRPVD